MDGWTDRLYAMAATAIRCTRSREVGARGTVDGTRLHVDGLVCKVIAMHIVCTCAPPVLLSVRTPGLNKHGHHESSHHGKARMACTPYLLEEMQNRPGTFLRGRYPRSR